MSVLFPLYALIGRPVSQLMLQQLLACGLCDALDDIPMFGLGASRVAAIYTCSILLQQLLRWCLVALQVIISSVACVGWRCAMLKRTC
jgi:hypothetical protein